MVARQKLQACSHPTRCVAALVRRAAPGCGRSGAPLEERLSTQLQLLCKCMCKPPETEPARPLPLVVEDAVNDQVACADPDRTLSSDDFFFVLTSVTETVVRVMTRCSRSEMDEEDRAFIARRVRKMVHVGPGASLAMMVSKRSSDDARPASCRMLHMQRSAATCRQEMSGPGGLTVYTERKRQRTDTSPSSVV